MTQGREALSALHKLEGIGWLKPHDMSSDEYDKICEQVANFLGIDKNKSSADFAANVKSALEKSNRKLFAVMSETRKLQESLSKPDFYKESCELLKSLSNDFERFIFSKEFIR